MPNTTLHFVVAIKGSLKSYISSTDIYLCCTTINTESYLYNTYPPSMMIAAGGEGWTLKISRRRQSSLSS